MIENGLPHTATATRGVQGTTANSSLEWTQSNTSDVLTIGIGGGTDIGTVHQGITTDGTYYYGFDTGAIKKFDLSWNLLLTNASASTDVGVNHLGDGCYYDGKLYVACVNWSGCPSTWDSGRIGVWNALDLSFVKYVDVSSHNFDPSGCCIDTDDNILWVSGYCGAGTICKYDLADIAAGTATYLGSITPSPATSYIQGIEYNGGALYFV
jgi:hypothetical protein